jgi:hypothetical protein
MEFRRERRWGAVGNLYNPGAWGSARIEMEGTWRASLLEKWKILIPIAGFMHSGSIVTGVLCQVVPVYRMLCGFSNHDDRSESSRYVSRAGGTRWDEARGIAVAGMRPLKREPVMSKGCHWVPPGAIKQGFGALGSRRWFAPPLEPSSAKVSQGQPRSQALYSCHTPGAVSPCSSCPSVGALRNSVLQ